MDILPDEWDPRTILGDRSLRTAVNAVSTTPGVHPVRRYPDRYCPAEGCGSKLSMYNPGPFCHVHEERDFGRHNSVVKRRSPTGTTKHGTRSAYVNGCRCAPCKAADKAYQHDRYERHIRRMAASS